eukprot:COSAG06_NODE_84_length_25090_cov_20.561042_18_plen_133_part_00
MKRNVPAINASEVALLLLLLLPPPPPPLLLLLLLLLLRGILRSAPVAAGFSTSGLTTFGRSESSCALSSSNAAGCFSGRHLRPPPPPAATTSITTHTHTHTHRANADICAESWAAAIFIRTLSCRRLPSTKS